MIVNASFEDSQRGPKLMNFYQLQDPQLDIHTLAAWVTVISGIVSITVNVYRSSDWSATNPLLDAITDAFWAFVELICVAITALGVAVVWTSVYYGLRVYYQSGLLLVPRDELRLVFSLVFFVTTACAWVALLFDEEGWAAFVIAFFSWCAAIIATQFLGEIQYSRQLGEVAAYSLILAALTSPLAIALGDSLMNRLKQME